MINESMDTSSNESSKMNYLKKLHETDELENSKVCKVEIIIISLYR